MESQQDIPENSTFEGVSGSKYYYVRDYTAPQNISLGLTNDHIMAGAKRKGRPPARLIQGERDIPQLEDYKLRKRTRSSTTPTQVQRNGRKEISVIIPPCNDVNYDSDDSPLTDLEHLADQMGDFTSDCPLDDAEIGAQTPPEDPQAHKLGAVDEQDECVTCAGKIINLRHQTHQLLICRGKETEQLGKQVESLQRQNNWLTAELAKVKASRRRSSTSDPAMTKFPADELLAQRTEIHRLRRRLESALEFVELTRRPLPGDDAFAVSTGFVYNAMDTLSNYVAYTANALCKIQVHDFHTRKDHTPSVEMAQLIEETIVNDNLLSSDPVSAFRALIFGFIRERIFQVPEIWRELHFDGLMLRQYQSILEQSISPKVLERYHRAAVHLTVTKSAEFKETFVPGYVEQLQYEFLNMMTPFIQSEDIGTPVKRRIRTVFRDAIYLRARCYPQKGTRYQLVQFKPGQLYDPQSMRAEDEVGGSVPVPEDGRQRRIKVCVHGLMKGYSVQDNAAGLDLIKKLSQPFLLGGNVDGQIISDKAVVILE